jgi:hypothetical protein
VSLEFEEHNYVSELEPRPTVRLRIVFGKLPFKKILRLWLMVLVEETTKSKPTIPKSKDASSHERSSDELMRQAKKVTVKSWVILPKREAASHPQNTT